MQTIRSGNPLLAFLLNCACFLAGPGYLYLGQRRKALICFGVFASLLLVEWLLGQWSLGRTALILNPLLWVFMVITALDASILASRARKGEQISRHEVALDLLGWMRLREPANSGQDPRS